LNNYETTIELIVVSLFKINKRKMKIFVTTLGVLLSILSFGQESYKVSIDLTKTSNDQVPVSITVPSISSDVVEYHMAKVVPGTYSISDFGRFVTDFKAFDKKGKELKVTVMGSGKNIYRIEDANKLTTITYNVHDTFDKAPGYDKNIVFEPGGTNIEAEKDVFLMNTFGFIGYIDGMKFNPYEVSVKHKETIYGATSLTRKSATADMDVFTAQNFNFLADAPIMYSVPDTVTREIAGAKIIVSVYSPNGKIGAKDVMDNIYDLMVAQSNYLGGKLPVDRYAYLIYLMDYNSLSGAMGALEHSYSSLYTLPEGSAEQLAQTVRDVAAHEFFHIVTPLSIHSEEIHDFNYIDPKMSEHLWLYEGVTEYSSMHVQVRYGLYDQDKFLSEVKQKLQVADQFPGNVSFTEMSRRILEPKFEKMYTNVYYKGALIGMCLDLHLLKHSNGTKDLQWLMRQLSKEYGINKAFKDSELFSKIEELTYPEIGMFLRNHVGGDKDLPIAQVLEWAGISYVAEKKVTQISLGKIGIGVNDKQELVISNTSSMNEFGKLMGYQKDDVMVSLNGKEVNLTTVQSILDDYSANTKSGDKVVMVVRRTVDGQEKEVTLSAEAIGVEVMEKHFLEYMSNPTPDQTKIRNLWLSVNQ
jgi:predicted metalloprotease with PDZ domain